MLGASLGSFVNLYVYRMPAILLESDSSLGLARPNSFCPQCKTPIARRDLIPVLGYFLARARCRACQQPIHWRYPLVEFVYGVLACLAWIFYPVFGGEIWMVLMFFYFGYPLVAIDSRHQLIPDNLTYTWIWLMLGLSALSWIPLELDQAVIGALAGFLVMWAVREFFFILRRKEGLGFGDVKLMLPLGALTGIEHLAILLLLASLTGLAWALFASLWHRASHPQIPFGPSLVGGAFIVFILDGLTLV